MAKKKTSIRKQQSEIHKQHKVRKRGGRGSITRTTVAAGLAFSIGGGLQGCAKTKSHDRDATVVDAGEDVTAFAILAPADAGKDSRMYPIMAPEDAGRDTGIYPIIPPLDAGNDGRVTSILPPTDSGTDRTVIGILPPADAETDVTVVAILAPADAANDATIYPIMPYGILPPSDSGFYGII